MRVLKVLFSVVFLMSTGFFIFKSLTGTHSSNKGAAIPIFEYVKILQKSGKQSQKFLLKDVVPNINWDTVIIYSRHKEDEFFTHTLLEFYFNNQLIAVGEKTLKIENDEFVLNPNQVYFKDDDDNKISLNSPQKCGKNTYLKIDKFYEKLKLFELMVFCDETP